MARENQGLQIALIVFVMFTIILGVTTFMFSKEYGKAKALAADSDKKASEANTALTQAESENMRLKVIVGQGETATLQTVDEAFNKDMATFAKDFNKADPNYKVICEWLFQEVQRKNAELSDEKQRVQQVKDQNASLEAAKEKQIEQLLARAKKAEDDLAAEQAKFAQAQVALNTLNTQLQQQNAKTLKEKQTVEAQAEVTKASFTKDKQKDTTYIKQLQNEIQEMDPIVVDHPDGVITYTGRGDTVSINLGRADGLDRLTNFAVFARDMTDVTTAGRKGAIEVIDVSDHSAVAQIVDENVSDPILAGDKIFTPLWSAGERQHFALTDGMDLDDDNQSDIDEVRNLITSNGGVVDFWLDDAGNKYGEITPGTAYLVEGAAPDDGSTMERLNARKWIIDEAKKYNLRQMSLADMLNRMGYQRKVHVVRYDSKANPNDFKPQAPEGVPRVSSGRVSDVFEKRLPPPSTGNSAY
ncbi:MAG: hypothetical protein ACYC6Y_25565 [Thermoguttaceae bacterium]